MEESWKLQGVGRYDKHFLEWKSQQGRGSKAKVPSIMGRVGGGGYEYFLELYIALLLR